MVVEKPTMKTKSKKCFKYPQQTCCAEPSLTTLSRSEEIGGRGLGMGHPEYVVHGWIAKFSVAIEPVFKIHLSN